MSDSAASSGSEDNRLADLDTRLRSLLRRKYDLHWRGKTGQAVDEAALGSLSELQDEIKALFDEIRLIDRKYAIPVLDMHPEH
jgi:hypothetical protein